jgi:hypothetical protein
VTVELGGTGVGLGIFAEGAELAGLDDHRVNPDHAPTKLKLRPADRDVGRELGRRRRVIIFE